MLSEVLGLDYDDLPEEENHVVSHYVLTDFPNVNLYVMIAEDEFKVLQVWLDDDE